MENPVENFVESQIKDTAGVLGDALLAKIPMLRDLLAGKPVELVIALQLRPKV